MKICLVSNGYPPEEISGLSRYLSDLAHFIAGKGMEVHVVAASNGAPSVEKDGKITIHKIPSLNMYGKAEEVDRMKNIFIYLDNLIKKENISLLSCHNFHTWSIRGGSYAMASALSGAINNVPCILTMHNAFYDDVDKMALNSTPWSKIICVSTYISELAYNAGTPIEKISKCYPGVNLKKFRNDLESNWLRQRIGLGPNEFLILSAMRIVDEEKGDILEWKGVKTLIKAFSIVAQQHPDIELLIAAPKPAEKFLSVYKKVVKKIMEQCQLLGIRDRVKIKHFSMDEMPNVYMESDLFVLPSECEPFGLVYIEAMASGVPVIGTTVGGVPEIIHNNVNGYIVEPKEPVELAKRITWLIEKPKKRDKFIKNGLETVREKFDLDDKMENLLGAYKSVVSKKGAARKQKKKAKKKSAVPNLGMLFKKTSPKTL